METLTVCICGTTFTWVFGRSTAWKKTSDSADYKTETCVLFAIE